MIDLKDEKKLILKYFNSIDLSSSVKIDSSKATYTNGILDLVLTKKESDDPKGIKVKVD